MAAIQRMDCLKAKLTHFGRTKLLRVKTNSVLCIWCGKWIHGRCTRMKMVTPKFERNYTCRKCEGNVGEAVEQEEKL